MSTLRNNVRLIGRVGNNPETKTFDNGTKVSLSLATSEFYYNDKKEKIETTQWHNIVAWGKTAELIQKYVEKGKEIANQLLPIINQEQADVSDLDSSTQGLLRILLGKADG